MTTDPRLESGALVNAKATAVTHSSHCQQLFGSKWKEGWFQGVVIRAYQKKEKAKTKIMKRWYILVKWACGFSIKEKEMLLCNVKAGPFPLPNGRIPDRQIEAPFPYELAELPCSESKEQDARHNITPRTQPSDVLRNNVQPATPSPQPTDLSRNDAHPVTRQSSQPSRQPSQILSENGAHREEGMTTHPAGTPVVLCEAHGQCWKEHDKRTHVNLQPFNRDWSVTGSGGIIIKEGTAPLHLTPLDYFFMMFPMSHLTKMVALTNQVLRQKQARDCTVGEILKFFGAVIMLTRMKFGRRREVWSTVSECEYLPPMSFGNIIPLHRFETLLLNLRYSEQPPIRNNMHSAEYRWKLCEDFLNAINDLRLTTVHPSQYLCVDESISRWYGIGGNWISKGLPHYVAIDRKPESGCEIQNICDAKAGFMLRLMFVKGSGSEDEEENTDAQMNHGTSVLVKLSAPWSGSWRIICGDAYFASVQTAETLYDKGLLFIGIIKQSTKKYPIQYLGNLPMRGKFSDKCMISEVQHHSGSFEILAVMWIDRNRKYFVATTGACGPAKPQERIRWTETDHGPVRKKNVVQMSSLCADYFAHAGAIDQHNRVRQDDLDIEKTLETNDWSVRVNSSLLGMCVVDAYLLYKGGRGHRAAIRPHNFFVKLATELVNNTFDTRGMRVHSSVQNPSNYRQDIRPASGVYEHLTPTKQFRREKSGRITKARLQRKCRVCGMKSKWVCSACQEVGQADTHLCHSETGRACFRAHLISKHLLSESVAKSPIMSA